MSCKKTYYLLGVVWDNKRCCTVDLPVSYDPFVLDCSIPKGLLDISEYKRKINISELLSVNTEEELNSVISSIAECSEVVICFNYKPISAVNELYSKRVKQIEEYLVSHINGDVLIEQYQN